MKNVIILSLLSIFIFTNKTIAQNSVENISTNAVYSTIQAAIDSSTNGDTIIAQSGTYLENINFNGKNIVLASEYFLTGDTMYIDSTIINGNQNGSCVVFENGEDTTALLSGFTITNGSGYFYPNYDTSNSGYYIDAYLGGGIYCDSASPRLFSLKIVKDSLLSSTGNKYGSGIYFNYSNSIIENCDISYNYSSYYRGSAIYCSSSDVKFFNSKIQQNDGGIGSINSNLYIEDVIIIDNYIDGNGGGIDAYHSDYYLNNVSLINNDSYADGGGIYCYQSNFNIYNTLIQNNMAGSGSGGGICISYSDSFNISNSKIIENSGFRSGGIQAIYSNLNFKNVEIVGNEIDDGIAGIEIIECTFDFRKCLIARNDGNMYSYSAAAFYDSQGYIINSTIANNYSPVYESSVLLDSCVILILNTIIQNNYAENNLNDIIQYDLYGNAEITYSDIGVLLPNSQIFTQNNIQSDPLFVNPIPTIPYTGYQNLSYHLLWNSPCIDAGIDFYVYNGDTILDLDPSEYNGSAPDMGYFEYGFQANAPLDIGVVDILHPVGMNCGLESTDSVIAVVRNFGSDTIINFTLYFKMGNSYSYFTVNDTIMPGNNLVAPPKFLNYSGPNDFDLFIWTGFPNGGSDSINSNDTLNVLLYQGTTIENFPYFTDFEINQGFWKSYSEQSSWEWGAPNGYDINSAPSGNNVWATNLSGMIFLEDSYIESPCFDFSNLIEPVINIDFITVLGSGEGAALQSSIDGGISWQYVGAVGDTGNWYNDTCSNLNIFGTNTGAWNSYGTQSIWQNASHELQYLAGESNVKFRLILSSQMQWFDSEGFAFDNFMIYDANNLQTVENITTNTNYYAIQEAINSSNNGDTIIAHPRSYFENINFNGKNIVVASDYLLTGDTADIDSTIINGNQYGSCVIFENEEDTTAMLCGFTITNGSGYFYSNYTSNSGNYYDAYLGGGIYCDSASPKLNSLKIVSNILYSSNGLKYGTGIFFNYSNTIMNNCNISDNFSNFLDGGAIYCLFSNIKITNSKIHENDEGITSTHSNVYLKFVLIFDNINGNGNGGGIEANHSYFNLQNVSLIDNTAYVDGGGIYSDNSEFNIKNSIIQNNLAGMGGGGGIFISSADSFNISNTKIIDNRARNYGGIWSLTSTLNFKNVEIVGNDDSEDVAGAFFSNCTTNFRNCLIVRNDGGAQSLSGIKFSSSQGYLINVTIANNNCYVYEAATVFNNSNITILNSIIYGNYIPDGDNIFQFDIDGVANIAYSNIGNLSPPNNIFLQENIQADPYFVYPIPTVPYSGYQNLNYELMWNSPCIDAGIDFYVHNVDTILDLDSSEYYGSAPDMGYYEYQFQSNTQIDIGVTDLVYPNEINCGLSSNESIILSVRNFGSQSVSNYYIYYSISQNQIDSILVNSTISSGNNQEISISNNFDFSTPNDYEIAFWTQFQNDTINNNDSLFTTIFSGTKIDNFPYFTDFENNNGFWKTNPEQPIWEWGVPTEYQIDTAFSGIKVWITNISGICYFENSFVESPCFDFSNLILPIIEFSFIINVYPDEGSALLSSTDDGLSWQYVGAIGDTGNWYNDTCQNLDMLGVNTGAWSYGNDIEWKKASHSLHYLAGESNVKFRFVISSSHPESDGFAFDDFTIFDYDTAQNIESIEQNHYILHQNTPNPFSENTEISFYVPKKTDVEISIYNILGEKIETLISKSFVSGNHLIKFNSKNYNSGTYFYKMTCPDFVDTKNMFILE
ncbi:MAG: T9SS type A sorting domain-containing protein [Bacteroidetes bacterium]|jgi:predicted outer membrane repeat protein|nr:T9SS type A sorting domain-containing protein [Bacteroidota bacterium]MBT7144509.1 T9SS type A sorting domain-containing protein [Bacteroidota bacterium]MBT7491647.1 T9SS type A sorting domain-containing protein [Bacteroidota bacterium]